MIFRFNDFELDDSLFELRRSGIPIRIAPRVFDTILFLARNQHRVVTKHELMQVVWQGATVTDDALSQAVRKARIILGAHGLQYAPIRTVRGRGYRFVPGLQGSAEIPCQQTANATATFSEQDRQMVSVRSATVRATAE